MIRGYIKEFFFLNERVSKRLRKMKANFGYDGFGAIVFYRTYSRLKPDGSNESWGDVVIRVINGCMSIRKDWYVRNFINWDEDHWQAMAERMAFSMFRMEWIPPGRGLWAMGTEFVYERGSMALNNCAFIKLKSKSLGADYDWMMDALMLGVGVGFEPVRDGLKLYDPVGCYPHTIPDDREGWANATKLLIDAFTKPGIRKPVFDYSQLRALGMPIKGFGGKASGPEPLKKLHAQIEAAFIKGLKEGFDELRLKTDIANQIGVCVVAGNVRRSAELCQGPITDAIFLDLKRDPEREAWGYMSNNSAILNSNHDFEMLHQVSQRVIERGEPGILNLRNFAIGRVGKKNKGIRKDIADGLNPCGEITLEDYELCNLVETCPTKCRTEQEWFNACEYATIYASTVSLLPTHRPETNRVVSRNRRIGVGIIDWTGWVHDQGLHKVTAFMRKGYKIVRKVNRAANAEAGVPESIKVTTMKPGGSVPKLPGLTSGGGYPTFKHTIRRISIAVNHPMRAKLDAAGIYSEPQATDPTGTLIYEYPIIQGPVQPATEVSLWQQAVNLATLQREWADNAVSNTLYFKPKWQLVKTGSADLVKEFLKRHLSLKDFDNLFNALAIKKMVGVKVHRDEITISKKHKLNIEASFDDQAMLEWMNMEYFEYNQHHEEDQILPVLASFAPLIKSCSLLPHTANGVYVQTPEEGITEEEYHRRKALIKPIDWTNYRGSDGEDEKYCQGDTCAIIPKSSPDR